MLAAPHPGQPPRGAPCRQTRWTRVSRTRNDRSHFRFNVIVTSLLLPTALVRLTTSITPETP